MKSYTDGWRYQVNVMNYENRTMPKSGKVTVNAMKQIPDLDGGGLVDLDLKVGDVIKRDRLSFTITEISNKRQSNLSEYWFYELKADYTFLALN